MWDHNPSLLLYELAALALDSVSDRQRRLFAVACLERFADRLEDPRCQQALEVARAYALGQATEEERLAAEEAAYLAHSELRDARFGGESLLPWTWQRDYLTRAAALTVSLGIYYAEDAADYLRRSMEEQDAEKESQVQLSLLREILGPWPRPAIQLRWLQSHERAVVHLATQIVTHREFELMPVLADALEDAGCAEEAILAHCRQSQPHCLGCWVLEAVLDEP